MDDCIDYGYYVLIKENIILFAVFIAAYLFTNISQGNQKVEKVLNLQQNVSVGHGQATVIGFYPCCAELCRDKI